MVNELYQCIEKSVSNSDFQDIIMSELSVYKQAEGIFGNPITIQ